MWSHLEVLSDSIPDIPIPTIYRQETHDLLMGVAPNLRLVVDSRKWHQSDRHPQIPISDDSDDWDICSVSSTDSSPNGYSSNCLSQTDAAIAMFALALLAGGLYVVAGGATSVRSGLECFAGTAFGAFSRSSFQTPNTPYTRNRRKPSMQFTPSWAWRGISPIPRWLTPVLTPNPRLSPQLGHSMLLSSSQQGSQNHSLSSVGRSDSQVCHQEPRYLKQTSAPSDNADLTAGGIRQMEFMSSSSASCGSGIPTGSELNQTPSSNNTSIALGLGMRTTYYASPIVSIAEEYRESLQPTEKERQHLSRFDYAPIHAPNSVGHVPKRPMDPFIFAVPKTFQFRLHFLGPSSETVYKLQDAETSTKGYRTLMEQIKRYLAEAGVASLLAEFKSGYTNPEDGQEEDGLLQPEPIATQANQHFFIAAYTGFSGQDTVLNPWDMVYAVQIAMACRESVVNIRLRQFCGTEMDFGELVPSGCRLLRFQPFSQKSRLLNMGLKDLEL